MMTKIRRNHGKCGNRNGIYELRLVIYLCANLFLLKKGKREKWEDEGGCDNIMSEEKRKLFVMNLFSCSELFVQLSSD